MKAIDGGESGRGVMMGDKAGGDTNTGGGGGDELMENNCAGAKKRQHSLLCGSDLGGCSREPENHQLLLHDQPASNTSVTITTEPVTKHVMKSDVSYATQTNI